MRTWLKQWLYRLSTVVDEHARHAVRMAPLDFAIEIASGNAPSGDYVEFGVFEGDSFARAFHRFETLDRGFGSGGKRRYFAYDAFAGLPASAEEGKPAHFAEGAFVASKATFLETLRGAKVDMARVEVIEGWFDQVGPEQLARHRGRTAAVVYIDCDLLVSTAAVLRYLPPLLADGTVVVLDDFWRHGGSAHRGVRRAWEEFLRDHPRFEVTPVMVSKLVAFVVHHTRPEAPSFEEGWAHGTGVEARPTARS